MQTFESIRIKAEKLFIIYTSSEVWCLQRAPHAASSVILYIWMMLRPGLLREGETT